MGVKEIDVGVVILAINEAENLRALIPTVRDVLDAEGVSHEILVVDGGSTDGTTRVAQERGARVWVQTGPGFGRALMEGIRESRGKYVLTLDADGSHNPKYIPNLWAEREKADVVVASRYAPGGGAAQGWFRSLLSRTLNGIFRRVLALDIHDLSGNFRLYRRRCLEEVDVTGRDFDVLEEILMKAHTRGFRLGEVPFRYEPRGEGRSKARVVKFGWKLLLMLVRLWRIRNAAFTADYDDRAYDGKFFLQRYWQRERVRIITGLALRRGGILDVGCGSSRILMQLPEALGVDISWPKLRWVRRRGTTAVRASVTALPFKTGAFPEVIFSQVIEHLTAQPQIMAEVTRVTADRGELIIGTPDYSRPSWPLLEFFYDLIVPRGYVHEHTTHFTLKSLRQLLHEHGFVPNTTRYVAGSELIIRATKR